jgi:MBG domain (YGX type)/Kelch motif
MNWTKDEWRQESAMKTFVDDQTKHAPSNVKPQPASRAINPLVTWAAIAFVGFLASIACAVPSFAQIVGTVQLNIERRGHTATLLEDGKVLIVGGDNHSGIVNQVELLDPASQTSSLAAMPIVARTDHTATRLADGRVLIIGGRDQNGSLTSTEIYNPLTATFTAGPSLTTPRGGHTATVLANGAILVAGGDASGSAELYNPTTQRFSLIAGSMNTARKFQSAILLNNGQVLIAGGVGAQNNVLNTAEVYDPSSQSFYVPPTDMQTPRALATLKLLADGKVQIIGGDAELSMEVFDPTNGIFIAKALLPPNADLLGPTLSTQSRAALFSPTISQDSLLQGVLTPEQLALLDRADHAITELPSRNQALVAGGINSAGQVLNSANLVKSSSASVTTDKTDYAPGQIVTITGNGFQPNEQVHIYFHEFPEEYPDIFLSAVANQQGNFVVAEFAPQQIDLGRVFTLTAIGQTSGFTAQTAFKDAFSTNTAISSSANPSDSGASVTFTATVTRASDGTSVGAVGSVDFKTGGSSCGGSSTPFATVSLNSSGQATASKTFTNPPASVTVWACYNGTGGSTGTQNSNASLTQNVNAAAAATTLTVSAANGTYGGITTLSATLKKTSDNSAIGGKTITFTLNGSAFAGNSAVTDISGVATLSSVSLIGISANTYPTGVGASFAGDSTFASSSGTNSLTINKADAVVVVTPYTVNYDGQPHTATVTSITGVNGETGATVGTVDVSNTTHTNAGTYATDTWSFTGTANYNNIAATTITDTINQANLTVTADAVPATATVDAFSKMFDNTVFSPFTVRYSGFVNNETEAVLGGTLTFSGAGTTAIYVGGPYTVTPGGLTSSNYNITFVSGSLNITTAFDFNGFYSPIGGSVESGNGGSFAYPVRTFKLGSTIPVKFGATWLNGGAALITGIHKLQAVKYSNATTEDGLVIDATPTDAATTGSEFRLTGTDWHFNLSTKGAGFKDGTWLLIATLQDGSTHTVWITIKK